VGGARYPESLVAGAKWRETGSKVIQRGKGRTVTERSPEIRTEGVTY